MSNQYQQYSTVEKYWYLVRSHILAASIVPILVGTAAFKIYFLGSGDHIKISLSIAILLACLLIQTATNMFNEYYDYKKGFDDHESVGIGGAIVRNGMSPKPALRLAIVFYVLAATLGLFLTANSSFWLLPIGLVCMAVDYLYADGPFPISWTPFDELFSGVSMGMFITVIAFFIQAGNIRSYVIRLSVPIVTTIGLTNMVNNIRDRVKNKTSGRKTLPTLLGKNVSLTFMAIMYFIAYTFIVLMTITKSGGSLSYLLASLPFPISVKAIRRFKKGDTLSTTMPAMAVAGKTNTFFGLLCALGIYISALFAGI